MTAKEKLIKKYNVILKPNDVLTIDEEENEISLFDTYLVTKDFTNTNEMYKCALELLAIEQNITRLNHKTKGNKNAEELVEEIHLLDTVSED